MLKAIIKFMDALWTSLTAIATILFAAEVLTGCYYWDRFGIKVNLVKDLYLWMLNRPESWINPCLRIEVLCVVIITCIFTLCCCVASMFESEKTDK